jgi:hypothetical protein
MTDISTELREALLREMRLTSLGPNGTRDREQKARSVLVLEIGHPVYDEVESLLGVGAGRANRGGHASEPEARAVLIVEPAHPVYDEVEFLIGNAAERMSLGIVASAILEHQARMSLLGQSESQAAAFAEARPVHAITKNRTAIDVRVIVFSDDDYTEPTGEALNRRTLVDAVPRAGEYFVPGQLEGFTTLRPVVHHIEHAPFSQYSDEPTVIVVMHLAARAESDNQRLERQGQLRAGGWNTLARPA